MQTSQRPLKWKKRKRTPVIRANEAPMTIYKNTNKSGDLQGIPKKSGNARRNVRRSAGPGTRETFGLPKREKVSLFPILNKRTLIHHNSITRFLPTERHRMKSFVCDRRRHPQSLPESDSPVFSKNAILWQNSYIFWTPLSALNNWHRTPFNGSLRLPGGYNLYYLFSC